MFKLTPVVRNLLIANIAVYLAQISFSAIDITAILALWNFESEHFRPYQLFTYMFAHDPSGFRHILYNMLGVVVFGPMLERFWGEKRFLIFYLVCGIGAAVLYSGIKYGQNQYHHQKIAEFMENPNAGRFYDLYGGQLTRGGESFVADFEADPDNLELISRAKGFVARDLSEPRDTRMIGASGALYAIIMAFALLFPNTELMLIFPPIPVKAKYLAMFLGGLAIYMGFTSREGDNVAHLAHITGMLFGFIMVRYWKGSRDNFY